MTSEELFQSVIDSYRSDIERLRETINEFAKNYGEFRGELRQILADNDLRSHPGWTDQEIVDAFNELIGKLKNESHLVN